MNSVPGLGPVTSSRVTHPNSLAQNASTVVKAMATAKPANSVLVARQNKERLLFMPGSARSAANTSSVWAAGDVIRNCSMAPVLPIDDRHGTSRWRTAASPSDQSGDGDLG